MDVSRRTVFAQSGVAVALVLLSLLTTQTLTTNEWWFLDGANLIFHEAGHAILLFAPEFVTVLGGTLVQVGIPLVCTVYFYRHHQYLSSCIAGWWVGQNLINVSVYVGDAQARVLPLLGEGHDWAYLLGRMGVLQYDGVIASTIFGLGALVMLGAIALVWARLFPHVAHWF